MILDKTNGKYYNKDNAANVFIKSFELFKLVINNVGNGRLSTFLDVWRGVAGCFLCDPRGQS